MDRRSQIGTRRCAILRFLRRCRFHKWAPRHQALCSRRSAAFGLGARRRGKEQRRLHLLKRWRSLDGGSRGLKPRIRRRQTAFGSGVSINRNIALVGVPRHGEGAILDGELNAGIVYPVSYGKAIGWVRQQGSCNHGSPGLSGTEFRKS